MALYAIEESEYTYDGLNKCIPLEKEDEKSDHEKFLMYEVAAEKFTELQGAFQRCERLKQSIIREQSEKAKQGILSENVDAKDWKAYEIAQHNFDALILKYLSNPFNSI